MRVLHVIHSLSGGGAERQLSLLVAAAQSAGLDMAVLCARSDGAYSVLENVSVCERAGHASVSFGTSIVRAIKGIRPDIIHVWLPPVMTIPAMFAGFLLRVPVVFSYRNAMAYRRKLDVVEFVIATMFSKRIISNTRIETCTAPYRWLYRLKRGRYIANAVSVPVAKRREPRREQIKKLVFVGRITQAKNWTTMLAAVSGLRGRDDWRLDIYGKGEQEKDLRHAIERLGIGSQVVHHGYNESIYDAMAAANAIVVPSLYEGMPNVLLEALAVGIYVIASDIPANRQVIGSVDCVSWFSPRDSDALRERIEAVLDDSVDVERRTAMGTGIAKIFSIDNTLKQHLDVYAELLDGRS